MKKIFWIVFSLFGLALMYIALSMSPGNLMIFMGVTGMTILAIGMSQLFFKEEILYLKNHSIKRRR